jgi:hypothetical protein
MVSDKKIFMGISHSVLPLGQLQPNFGGMVLGWPPSKLCPVIPTSNQDGHQPKNRKKGGGEIKKKSSPLKLLSQSFGCGGHLGRRAEPPNAFLEENHPMTISSKFSSY